MTTPEVIVPNKEMESVIIQDKNEKTSHIHVETFFVETNATTQTSIEDFIGGDGGSTSEQKAIVGTVTFFNKSAMVWISWGDVQDNGEEEGKEKDKDNHVCGKGVPPMGPMVVAMPRSKYIGFGASSSRDNEPPCSQLISSFNDEEMMLGWQMASRLTKKVGWPVFVSTSLDHSPQIHQKDQGDNDMIGDMTLGRQDFSESSVFHLIALAEKKVGEIILQRKNDSI